MATRSYVEDLRLWRNKAITNRKLNGNLTDMRTFDEERVSLVQTDGLNEYRDDSDDSAPTWLPLVDEFRYEAAKVSGKIDQLRDDQENFVRIKASALFDENEKQNEKSLEVDIETKSQEITRLFNRLHGLVLEMKNLVGLKSGSKLLKNILQYEYREIASLSEKLRSHQRSFLAKLTDREKYAEHFVINFDEIDLEDNPTMTFSDRGRTSGHKLEPVMFDLTTKDDLAVRFDNNSYMQSQLYAEDDTDLLRERDAEMSGILKSIVELNQIFQEMNNLTVNQGSLLDRIDYNLETVQIKVEEGAIQLSRAERSARSARKMKCIMAGIGTVLIALLIFIIQS